MTKKVLKGTKFLWFTEFRFKMILYIIKPLYRTNDLSLHTPTLLNFIYKLKYNLKHICLK